MSLYLDHVTAEDVPAPVLVGGGGHPAARAGHAGPGQSPEMTAAADVTRSPDPGIYPLLIFNFENGHCIVAVYSVLAKWGLMSLKGLE